MSCRYSPVVKTMLNVAGLNLHSVDLSLCKANKQLLNIYNIKRICCNVSPVQIYSPFG